MKNRRLGIWIVRGFTWLLVAWCFWAAGNNLWTHLRMRAIQVEVVRSSLLLDASRGGTDLDLTLRLDLKSTDASGRLIHWEDEPGHAAYPEEAYDELRNWAPGSRHQIHQLRGQAREIRLPSTESAELGAMGIQLVLGTLLGFFAFVYAAVLNEESSFRGAKRFVGIWTVFFLIGAGALFGAALFARYEIPKRTSWTSVVATLEPVPEPSAEAPLKALPENVVITPAGRKLLEESSYKVLRFNGLHAGLGRFGGRYEELAKRCASGDQECRFVINPNNRWEVELDSRWDQAFFVPLGMFSIFGLAFCGAGLMIRRNNL